ncbi:cytochrome c oxidase subunit II [Halobaculum magnesiiphilum]|uniref:Cytochrome c oxidase subunit II n=1 Tax=Halobaculum magnesiiphilum TaxID=1017351 RepID=A0A8T8WDL1_9EURY|nr:cytochrome c oxidase subunit II [Halobaculum magnesiiphilum]QZP37824.1 cytochrome c oxidase subunit II [Halobaculum magnesiiphilum]
MIPCDAAAVHAVLLHTGGSGLVPRGTRAQVFNRIFEVFLILGVAVGVVVLGYMGLKAYQYRRGADHDHDDVERPQLGELPKGSEGGGKLFVSFGMSAVIVVSLISWTYLTLLYVEDPGSTAADPEAIEVEVVGGQFSWTFIYPNGHESDVLRAPTDTDVHLVVSSRDVFHNFGIPELRVKSDAIPGQTTETWFVADEPGRYQAHCYELCGSGHSYMDAQVVIMEEDAFEAWYANTSAPNGSAGDGGAETNASVSTTIDRVAAPAGVGA